MFETWLRREGVREQVEITWSTFEQSYIQAFGPRLHEVVSAEFSQRGIDGHTGEVVTEIAAGEARYADGSTRAFDHLIAFPPYVSAVRYEALPSDERGFIHTEMEPARSSAYPTSTPPAMPATSPSSRRSSHSSRPTPSPSTSPRRRPHAFEQPFDPVSMCIMEMFDKATFAQVPLELTGDPARRSPCAPTQTATTRSAPGRPGGWARRCSALPSRCASTPASPSTPARLADDGCRPQGHVRRPCRLISSRQFEAVGSPPNERTRPSSCGAGACRLGLVVLCSLWWPGTSG